MTLRGLCLAALALAACAERNGGAPSPADATTDGGDDRPFMLPPKNPPPDSAVTDRSEPSDASLADAVLEADSARDVSQNADAMFDAFVDASVDASIDAPVDVTADASADVTADVTVDAPTEYGPLRFGEAVCVDAAPSLDRAVPADLDAMGARDLVLEYRGGEPSQPPGFAIVRNRSTAGALAFEARLDRRDGIGAQFTLAADLDGDGLTELVRDARWWARGAEWFAGSANVFVSGLGTVVPDAASLTVADLDLDGRPDVAATLGSGGCNALAYPNVGARGAPSFALQQMLRVYVRPATRCTSLVAGDLDGDRRPELLVTSSNPDLGSGEQGFAVLRNLTAPGVLNEGSFAAPVKVFTAPSGVRLGLAGARLVDLDGDGRLDLVHLTTRPDGAAVALVARRNDGGAMRAGFGDEVTVASSWPAMTVQPADLDGDGLADLATVSDGRARYALNRTGRGGVIRGEGFEAGALDLGADARGGAFADMDGDGRDDVVFARAASFCVRRALAP